MRNVRKEVWEKVGWEVDEKVWGKVRVSVRWEVDEKVWGEVWDKVDDKVGEKVLDGVKNDRKKR